MLPDLRASLAASLGPGIVLGDELGGGGMSRVFRARDTALARDIVVKVLAPELAGDLSVERFRREIVVAAGLQHPLIVPVLAAGEADGTPWYTMPFVAGESLQRRLDGRARMATDAALDVLRDVARALAAAHAQGIVHRDVKPANVLLADGAAVVTDFGIAKAIVASRTQGDAPSPAGATGLTRAGMSMGTPAYMAPEQVAGDAVDARADVYAWGVVAYEMLAGRHPFAERVSAQAMLAAHLAESPAPLATVARDVPPAVADVVMRTLAKEPAARPANGGALVAALDAAVAGARSGDVAARPPITGPSKTLQRVLIGAAVVALGAEAALYARGSRGTAADDRPAGPPLLAVAPFATVGGDSTFADGLGEAITNKLSRLGGLRVIDRASVLSLGPKAGDLRTVADELGAQFVMRATVRWARDAAGEPRVQVTPVIVRVADGTQLWSGEPVTATPTDPFAAEATIASQVADALDIAVAALERQAIERPTAADPRAVAAYERGRRALDAAVTGVDVSQAVMALRDFDEAMAIDPRYAPPMSQKALALIVMGGGGFLPPDSVRAGQVLARRAIELDPSDWQGYFALARAEMQAGRVDSARPILERGIAAAPSNGALQLLRADLGYALRDTAMIREGVRRALVLAPRSVDVVDGAIFHAYVLRDSALATTLVRRLFAVAPERTTLQLFAMDVLESLGDTTALATAWASYRANGGALGPNMLGILRHGTTAMRRELDTLTLAAMPGLPEAAADFHLNKLRRALDVGDRAAARRLAPEAERRLVAVGKRPASPVMIATARATTTARRALVVAAGGDLVRARLLADSAAALAATLPPGTEFSERTNMQCRLADAWSVIGDRDATVRALSICLAGPAGVWPSRARLEPSWRPYLDDPRLASLMRGERPATPQPVRR